MQFLKIGKDLSEFYQKFRVSNSNGQISVRAEFEKSSSLPLLQKVETVPQNVYYEYLKSQQALMGSVVNLLSTKRELAKIEEDKESISFQILDSPSMPNRRDEPKRAIICLIGLLLGTMMALAYCIFDYHVKSILESERTKSV